MGVIEGCRTAMSSCKDIEVPKPTDNDNSTDEFELNEKGEQITFNTKIERMIFKLKYLRKRALEAKDKPCLKHINW